MRKLLTASFVILVFGLFTYKVLNNYRPDVGESSGEGKKDSIVNIFKKEISPTPFPFMEMTMPYLKSRTYKSSLGDLQRVSENTSYTSYITSYNSDGYKVYGLLTIPRGETGKKYPAIVFVHGYIAPTVYRTNSNYASYVDHLARRGYAVFKIDLRGHDKSEGEPGGAYYSGDYVVDTLNAYNALQNADFIDPLRVGLWGHSMAGNVTFRSFVANGNIPALIIWAGAGYTYDDLSDYRINDNSYRPPDQDSERARKRQELADTYGAFDNNSSFWKQVPATNYLDGVKGAVQLNHAVDDSVVSIEYSRNLINVLDGTKIVHELNEFSTGGHNISGTNFGKAMQNTIEFFDEHL